MSAALSMLLAFGYPVGWAPHSAKHARPNKGRWIGALWHDGRLVSADRFTSKSRARKWANRSRDAYGCGVVAVVLYRAKRWHRMTPMQTEVRRLANHAKASRRETMP